MSTATKKLVVFLAVLLVVSTALAACGKSNSDGKGASGETKKITLFNSKVEITEALEALVAEYKKDTGVEVEVWGTSGDSYNTTLRTRLTSNQGPTIFSTSLSEAASIKSYLYDMSNAPYVKDIAPNMALMSDDKVVGVPYGVEGFGLIYNKNLVKPEDVQDLASFTATLEKFKADGISGLDLSQEAYFLIGHIINAPFAIQSDPVAFVQQLNKGEVKMADTKEFQEFAKFMAAIKANARNPLEIKYDDQIGDLATGKAAMIHQGNWAYGMFNDYGELDFEMGMMPFPLAGNKKLAVDVASYWSVNANATAGEQKAAIDFLNWMLTSDIGKKYIVEEFKFIPAMTNIEANELDPLSKAVLEASNSGETLKWAYNYFPPGIIQNDLVPVAQEYFTSSNMTEQQLLEKLDAAWANGAKSAQ